VWGGGVRRAPSFEVLRRSVVCGVWEEEDF